MALPGKGNYTVFKPLPYFPSGGIPERIGDKPRHIAGNDRGERRAFHTPGHTHRKFGRTVGKLIEQIHCPLPYNAQQ